MKKVLSVVMALVAAVACMFAVTACGEKGSGTVNVRTKNIVVAYTDYQPMNYTENGELKGFDTELALMVFNSLGYEVQFKLIDWKNKYQELSSGTVDCLWNGFTANTTDDDEVKRSDKVNFSYGYLKNTQCVIRKASAAKADSLSSLSQKTVAVEEGSAGEDFVNTANGVNKKNCGSQMDAVREVKSGTADYAIVDLLLASSVAGKGDFSDLAFDELTDAEPELYAIGFRKDDAGAALRDKVNVMIEAFAKTGQYKELSEKYGIDKAMIDGDFPTID